MSNKATHVSGWERPAGEAPGQIMDAVVQCQGMQGDTSFPCPFVSCIIGRFVVNINNSVLYAAWGEKGW
jgi:hypothetical protein